MRPAKIPRRSTASQSKAATAADTATVKSAVVYSVDNPTNPTRCAVLVEGAWPPVDGYWWPASIKTTFTQAPNPLVPPPTGGSYYCNYATQTGGTLVSVDTVKRTVVNVTGGYSTLAPYNYQADYQYIKHNGAQGPNGAWQQPGKIDITQLAANPNPTAAPSFASGYTYASVTAALTEYMPAASGASGSVTAKTKVGLSIQGETVGNPLWLAELNFYAVPAGVNFVRDSSTGTYPGWKQSLAPVASGVYTPMIDGLNPGASADLYVTLLDLAGNETPGLKFATATPAALVIGSVNQKDFPGGTVPSAALSYLYASAPYNNQPFIFSGTGTSTTGTTYNAEIPFYTDSTGSASNDTLFEIQLVARVHGQTNWQQCGTIAPATPGNTTDGTNVAEYVGVFQNLGFSNAYDLGVRYLSHAGKPTAVTTLVTNFSVALALAASALQSMPNNTTVNATLSGSLSYSGIGSATYSASGNVLVTISDSNYTNWLSEIRVIAKQIGGSSLDTDTVASNFPFVFSIPAKSYGGSSTPAPFTIPLPAAAFNYEITVLVVDQQGKTKVATPFAVASAQQIANNSLSAMPSNIKANGPSVSSASAVSRTARKGTSQSLSASITLSDFGSKPAWLDAIYIPVRFNGDGDNSFEISWPYEKWTNNVTSISATILQSCPLGQSVDLGLYYTDQTGAKSQTVWPSAWTGISDPNGDAIDTTTGRFVHPRQSTQVQGLIDGPTGALKVSEFNGAMKNTDGSLFFSSGTGTSVHTFSTASGTVVQLKAIIAGGTGGSGTAGIGIGNTTNGYFLYFNQNAVGYHLTRYSAGVATTLVFASKTYDTNYHTYQLNILLGSTVTLEAIFDGVALGTNGQYVDTTPTTGMSNPSVITVDTNGSSGKLNGWLATLGTNSFITTPGAVQNVVDVSGTLDVGKARGGTSLPFGNHSNVLINKHRTYLSVWGQQPYYNGMAVVFPSKVQVIRTDGTFASINGGTSFTMGSSQTLWVNMSTGTLVAVNYNVSTYSDDAGYEKVLYVTGAGKVTMEGVNSDFVAAVGNVITDNGSGSGSVDVSKATGGTKLPYNNTSSEYQTNFDSGGKAKATTLLNTVGNVAPMTTDAVLEYSTPSVATGVSTTVKFWVDNGTSSGDPKVWRADLASPTASNYSFIAAHSGTSSSPMTTVSCTGGQTVYIFLWYSLSLSSWQYLTTVGTPPTVYNQIQAQGDGVFPCLFSLNASANQISGGSGSSGGHGIYK